MRSTNPLHTFQINLFNLQNIGEDVANDLHLQDRSQGCVRGWNVSTRNWQSVKDKYADQPATRTPGTKLHPGFISVKPPLSDTIRFQKMLVCASYFV